ncbi:MAG: hypothetical protein IMX03_05995 [Brockia lithotrophica]|nr:hypothetical protein [Brockia lithotrophica]
MHMFRINWRLTLRYRELVERTMAFANNLVAAGRPKGLTSRTAGAYLAGDLPSAVIHQALREVAPHRDVQMTMQAPRISIGEEVRGENGDVMIKP